MGLNQTIAFQPAERTYMPTREFDEHGIERLEIIEQLVRPPTARPLTHD
jgi:hypothetical protein